VNQPKKKNIKHITFRLFYFKKMEAYVIFKF